MGIEIKFENHFAEVMKQVNDHLKERMNDACETVRDKAIDLIRTPSPGGRTYDTYFYTDKQGKVRPVGERDTPHAAAPPGSPPNTDTGDLQQNISYWVSGNGYIGAVGTNMMHGLYQEVGTSKIKPRPWLRPAFIESENAIKEMFQRKME